MRKAILLVFSMAIATISAAKADPVPLSAYADANGFIDVQALTCGQLANTYQEDANALTSWYSGWYNGLAHILRDLRGLSPAAFGRALLARLQDAWVGRLSGVDVGDGWVFGCGHNVRFSRALLASRGIGIEKKPGLKPGLVRVCPGFIVRVYFLAGRSSRRNRSPGAPESASCGE
jgi:hypothetical protein